MPTSQNFTDEIAFISDLRSLVSTYEEIAVMRIGKVRTSVLNSRQFREGLSKVFRDVRASHQHQITQALKKQKKPVGNRQAAVLLSTDSRLTGQVTADVARSFAVYIRQHQDTDAIVIGQVGKERLSHLLPDRQSTFFSLKEDQPTMEDLKPLLRHLLQYDSISVFFPRFHNLIKQSPTQVRLSGHTGQASDKESVGKVASPGGAYLFEPSLEKVVDFFNTQIFAIVLQQTRGESWLSLLGSRITAMEQATGKIDEQLKKLEWAERREERRVRNRKQRDRLAGIALWQK